MGGGGKWDTCCKGLSESWGKGPSRGSAGSVDLGEGKGKSLLLVGHVKGVKEDLTRLY